MSLRKVIKETNEAVSWIAAEYKFLQKLKDDIDAIAAARTTNSAKALRQAKRALRYLNRCEGKAEQHIERLKKGIKVYPELATLGGSLDIAENQLIKAFSFYRGSFRQALQDLTKAMQSQKVFRVFGKQDKITAGERKINSLAQGIDKHLATLVPWVQGLQAELAKIKTEERRMLLKGMVAVPVLQVGMKAASVGGFLSGLFGFRGKSKAQTPPSNSGEEVTNEDVLRALNNKYGFFDANVEKTFVENYNKKLDYSQKYFDILNHFITLDLVAYAASHTLTRIFPIPFRLSRIEIINALELERRNPDKEDTFDIIFFGRKKDIRTGEVLGDFKEWTHRIISDLPRPYYHAKDDGLAGYFLYAVAEYCYQQAKRANGAWVAKPWTLLQSSAYLQGFPNPKEYPGEEKLPYDQKTGEFVFFGRHDCDPCTALANFLLHGKIKFIEVHNFGAVPAVYYKGEYLLGQGKIITVIQEMYGLSQAKVEELKLKMK